MPGFPLTPLGTTERIELYLQLLLKKENHKLNFQVILFRFPFSNK